MPTIRWLSASAASVSPRSSMRNAACSWRAADDPLGLFLGLLNDPLPLLVDPLRRANFFGHGDAELVDEVEGGVPIDDHVARHRQRLAVRDQRLEPLDEEDDVQRTASGARTGPGGVAPDYGTRGDPTPTRHGIGEATIRAATAAREPARRPRAAEPSPTRRRRTGRSP